MDWKPKTFPVSLLSGGATLRTDIATSLAEVPGNEFTVDFQLLYEVHGALDPGDEDNASLFVVRMVPLPRMPELQFSKLEVQLSVDLVSGTGGDAIDDGEEMAELVSFEPAAEGTQFVDAHRTNEERTGSLKASSAVPISHAASLALEASRDSKSSFTRTHLLRVTARPMKTKSSQLRNGVHWRITAATKEQGIGDSFTVAMLVKRPQGSSFQLVADVSGDIGTFSEKARKIIGGLYQRKRPSTTLAILPLDRGNARIPPGVLEDNLHQASTINIMGKIHEVGLHLPELARPVTVIPGATSSTSIDLAKITQTIQNEDNPAGFELTTTASPAVAPSSMPEPFTTAAGEEPAASSTTTTETSVTGTAQLKRPPTSRDAFTHRADSQPEDPTLAVTLTAMLQELKQLRPLADHPNSPEAYRAASTTGMLTARRIQRLRETARLYERLADLYREEARELDDYGVLAAKPV